MAFTMSPTSSTVAITGSVSASTSPTPPSGATYTHIYGTTAASGSTVIHTVTAGKTLYITSATLASMNNAGGWCVSQLDADNGAGTYKAFLSINGAASAHQFGGISFPIAIQVAATKTVRITNSALQQAVYYSIVGYEV